MRKEYSQLKDNQRKPISFYDVVSNVALKLLDNISERKINNALASTLAKINAEYIGIYSQTEKNKEIKENNIQIIFFSEKTEKSKKIQFFAPSTTSFYGILITFKKDNIPYGLLENDEVKSNGDIIQILEQTWVNHLSNIFVDAVLSLEKNNQIDNKISELNRIIGTSDSIYTSWDQKRGWTYHNVNSMVKVGYKKNKIDINKSHQNNPIHKDDWKEIRPLFERCISEGTEYKYDYRTVGVNGITDWYHNYVKVTGKNPDGSTRHMTSISENITSIKKSEQLLIKSAEREEWLVSHANSMFNCNDHQSIKIIISELAEYLHVDRCVVRLIDPDTLFCNLIAEYHSENLISISEIFPDITSQIGIGWIGQLINLGKAFVVEDYTTDVTSKKLKNYHAAISVKGQVIHPLIHKNELMGYISLMTTDKRIWDKQELRSLQVIAETLHMAVIRNRLLDDLRANDARYELTMQSSSHGIWDFDLLKNQLYISPHYFNKLGYNANEAESNIEFIESITHPDDRHLLSDSAMKLYSASESPIEIEVRQRHKRGHYVWILTRGKVVKRDYKGRPIRITGINTEIGEQKKALREIDEIRKKSVDENKTKSEFLERMSHEIRTPMNAITGMAYLTMDTDLNEEQTTYISDIDSAAKSLLRIIDDILDFSKIESGELTIVNEPFSLKNELNRTVKLITLKAAQRDNTLEFKVSEDVPEFVIGDANRLGQILLNLLSNAVKFTNKGSITLSAQVAEIHDKKNTISLLFSVSDSGIGLEKDQIKTLFDPFVQAEDSTTRHFGGTGLGLSICKNLVEMMGGSIHVISLPNIGTTFHFTVNFKIAEGVEPPSENESILKLDNSKIYPETHRLARNNKVFSQGTLEGKHILLVEDNVINQKVAKGILTKFGLTTTEALNGKEAIDILESTSPLTFDAILMDIEMPVLNGISTSKKIREQSKWNHLPIIAMTAHAMVGDKERCLSAGMNDYIPKPVNPAQLIRTLMTAIKPNID